MQRLHDIISLFYLFYMYWRFGRPQRPDEDSDLYVLGVEDLEHRGVLRIWKCPGAN
jgi:hypothetical protein